MVMQRAARRRWIVGEERLEILLERLYPNCCANITPPKHRAKIYPTPPADA